MFYPGRGFSVHHISLSRISGLASRVACCTSLANPIFPCSTQKSLFCAHHRPIAPNTANSGSTAVKPFTAACWAYVDEAALVCVGCPVDDEVGRREKDEVVVLGVGSVPFRRTALRYREGAVG